jgi:3-phenylpropionate/trans-cinnamate dioxygenase ferredoxin reductase subunit
MMSGQAERLNQCRRAFDSGFPTPDDDDPRHLADCGFPETDTGGLLTRTAPRGSFLRLVVGSVVVVGNGVSGFACSAELADRGVPVTMIGPGLPHDRPPLSKRSLLTGRLPQLASSAQLDARGIRHIDGIVEACNLSTRRLNVKLSTGKDVLEIEAPNLVWATGLRYPKPPVPGFERAEENATGAGFESLTKRLASPGRRVVVVGAGLIGTETAATLAQAHEVTLVDMVDRPLGRLLPRVSEIAVEALDARGVRFLGSCRIETASIDADGAVVHTSTHGDLACDVVVSAAGFRSSLPPELAGDDPRTLTLAADEHLRVIGHEGFWACGDCVSFPHPRWGQIAIPHWDHALWSGRHVAGAILGSLAPYAREPYFFSDIGAFRVQQLGIADVVVDWSDEDGMSIGRDECGAPACVLLLNAPARLREAREALAAGAASSQVKTEV